MNNCEKILKSIKDREDVAVIFDNKGKHIREIVFQVGPSFLDFKYIQTNRKKTIYYPLTIQTFGQLEKIENEVELKSFLENDLERSSCNPLLLNSFAFN